METIEGKNYYTVEEAASVKGVSIPTVYKAIKEGKLRYILMLSRRVFTDELLAEWHPQAHGRPKKNPDST